MKNRLYLFLSIISLFFLFSANYALGDFGITPPYVKNDSLTRNSIYEQQIILVRSEPVDDLKATVTVNVPGADDWITINPGKEFILPRGAQQVPMTVHVKVPDSARFADYGGNIRVVISPKDGPQSGTVGIALGAQIDVALKIVDRKIISFEIRGVRLLDANEGHQWWWFYFPGKIKFYMTVKNTGNIESSPRKVHFDITNAVTGAPVESIDSTNNIETIKPFETKEVLAELPTRLPPGSYNAKFKIFSDETHVAQEGELHLSILPFGTVAGDTGYGFWGLTLREKSIIVGGIALILGILFLIVFWIWRKVRKSKL